MPQDEDEWTAAMKGGELGAAWSISDRILAERIARGGFDYSLPRHLQSIWRGQPLAGKHVLVRCYHGLGDTVQFIRFAKPLRAIAREVSVWVQPPLLPLIASIAGVDRVLPLHDGIPDLAYDADIEIMELAHALRVKPAMLAADIPYIRVRAHPLQIAAETLRVGLIWSAGDWDPRRSMRLSHFEPLMRVPGIELIVLQRGPTRAEAAGYPLRDLGSDAIETFAATLAALDLLVTIDTFGAHLAGAMGVPTWVLLHNVCDWRWMSEGRASPWYPSMRLYRQRATGEWASVIADVARDLHTLTSRRDVNVRPAEQTNRCDVRTL
jgi:hypothetical protein